MTQKELTYKTIFKFWVPLAATWLMMSVEGPFLAAIIARMIEPKFNLAAYGVAFSFALMIEAPVIMIMSASTALVKNRQSFIKLRNFIYALNTVVTLFMLAFIIPGIFHFFAISIIELPQHVADLTYKAMIILLPWPGAIGYRRFYQGILIRNNLTRRVAYGTVIRLSSMSITAFGLYFFSNLDGVMVGASALSLGVSCEAVASRIMAWGIVKKLKNDTVLNLKDEILTYKGIYSFYYPLALTSIISLTVQPLVTFFIGQSPFPIESLAVLPVITSFVFIFRSLGLSFQEVGIALLGKYEGSYQALKNFAAFLGIITVVALGLIAFTPLSDFWFNTVSGLSLELTQFAKLPLIIMILMPGFSVLINFQRSVLVESRYTKPITWATITEVIGILLVLFISIKYFNAVGAVAATLAFMIGRFGAITYLMPSFRKMSYKKMR
ncbi:MAG TPA: hypothetical protein ENI57_08330 [Ignavibacteria bacterium]|nr:hypothetical protein [Ignavibacteria bacterium]